MARRIRMGLTPPPPEAEQEEPIGLGWLAAGYAITAAAKVWEVVKDHPGLTLDVVSLGHTNGLGALVDIAVADARARQEAV